MQVPRSGEPMSPSDESSEPDPEVIAAAAAIPGSSQREYEKRDLDPYRMDGVPSGTRVSSYNDTPPSAQSGLQERQQAMPQPENVTTAPVQTQTYNLPTQQAQPVNQQQAPMQQTQQPYQPFLGGEQPADNTPDPLARHNSAYGDWMTPAAAGVAGVGAGALGTEAYRRHQRDATVPEEEVSPVSPEEATPPAVPQQSDRGLSRPAQSIATYTPTYSAYAPTSSGASKSGPSTGVVGGPSTSTQPAGLFQSAAGRLGGLEGKGAHETGTFPTIVRHDTDMSVSGLHVPGEYPKRV